MKPATANQRLLIVDDQPANIRIMAEALGDQYELFFATSGARALQIAQTNDIELVLLDVVMPELDGFEVCVRLKSDQRTSRVPVIFVTAREEMGDEARGFDVGGVDYITKPIQPTIVRARVRTHLELKRARDMLEALASVDPLTGIANRRRFDLSYEQEWKRAARTGSLFSLAILDVDFFKLYNDSYGHARGDDCLRLVAKALSSTIGRRPADVAARYGGEEFATILPDTDAHGAVLLMQELLRAIADLGIEHRKSQCSERVTVSIGAITLIPSFSDAPGAIVEAADRLLYEAKGNGRNQAIHLDLSTGSKQRISAGAVGEPSRS